MVQEFTWNSVLYLVLATRWTLLLAAVAFVGGAVGGTLITVASVSRTKAVRFTASGFIQIVQGIPLLMLLFMSYFGVSLLGFRVDAWISVSLALTLFSSAFLGDIWSSSVRTVHHGQWEAAKSLALTHADTLRFVIFPQAVRIGVPPTVGFLVQLIKGTALASIVGFVELTRSGQVLNNLTFKPFTIYLIVAAIYFVMCWPISLWSRRLEARLARPFTR